MPTGKITKRLWKYSCNTVCSKITQLEYQQTHIPCCRYKDDFMVIFQSTSFGLLITTCPPEHKKMIRSYLIFALAESIFLFKVIYHHEAREPRTIKEILLALSARRKVSPLNPIWDENYIEEKLRWESYWFCMNSIYCVIKYYLWSHIRRKPPH